MPNPFDWLFPCKQCAQLLAEVQLLRADVGHLASQLTTTEHTIMSALSDAVARITTSVQTEIAAVIAALNQTPPDVSAAVDQLNRLSDNLDAETAAVTPPPPTP
jgi:ABC-type transporter Mla subunit MlaD